MSDTCQEIAKMIDHSLLRPELTTDDVIHGCEIAKKYHVASVCCRPADVPLVAQALAGSGVKASTVIGFPHGSHATAVKVFEAEQAIRDGAEELDMVINIVRLRSRDLDYVKRDIAAVVEVARRQRVLVLWREHVVGQVEDANENRDEDDACPGERVRDVENHDDNRQCERRAGWRRQ